MSQNKFKPIRSLSPSDYIIIKQKRSALYDSVVFFARGPKIVCTSDSLARFIIISLFECSIDFILTRLK